MSLTPGPSSSSSTSWSKNWRRKFHGHRHRHRSSSSSSSSSVQQKKKDKKLSKAKAILLKEDPQHKQYLESKIMSEEFEKNRVQAEMLASALKSAFEDMLAKTLA